jgi:hypothetical protein
MVEREGPLSLRRQCQLLRLNRGAVYYEPVETGAYELELMALSSTANTCALRFTARDE